MESQIDYVTIATTGNAVDFGDLTADRRRMAASASTGIRGLMPEVVRVRICKHHRLCNNRNIGNAVDFGDVTQSRMN